MIVSIILITLWLTTNQLWLFDHGRLRITRFDDVNFIIIHGINYNKITYQRKQTENELIHYAKTTTEETKIPEGRDLIVFKTCTKQGKNDLSSTVVTPPKTSTKTPAMYTIITSTKYTDTESVDSTPSFPNLEFYDPDDDSDDGSLSNLVSDYYDSDSDDNSDDNLPADL